MRTVVQRVGRAEVRVDGEVVGRTGVGLLLLVVERGDGEADALETARKIGALRIFRARSADGSARSQRWAAGCSS